MTKIGVGEFRIIAPEDAAKFPDIEQHVMQPVNRGNLQLGANISVHLPSLYRYEDREWIDHFFETGHLRLSTVAKFAEYPGEWRGDDAEGRGGGIGICADGKLIAADLLTGRHAYVFCTSTLLRQDLKAGFAREGAFEIFDPIGFAAQIARYLPGLRQAAVGSVSYVEDLTIVRRIDLRTADFQLNESTLNMQMLPAAALAIDQGEFIFRKRLRYASQCEYRMVWTVDEAPASHIDIQCKPAVRFCRKVEL